MPRNILAKKLKKLWAGRVAYRITFVKSTNKHDETARLGLFFHVLFNIAPSFCPIKNAAIIIG